MGAEEQTLVEDQALVEVVYVDERGRAAEQQSEAWPARPVVYRNGRSYRFRRREFVSRTGEESHLRLIYQADLD